MGVRSSDGNTRGLTAGYPFKLITKSHDEAHSVIPATEGSENNGSTGMMMLAIFDRERTIRLTGTETSFLPIIIESDWQWAHYKISLVIYENGINYNVRERRTLFFADTNRIGAKDKYKNSLRISSVILFILVSSLVTISHLL